MMEHSPSLRQKARSLSSTHGLKTSERKLGSVGATAVETQRQRVSFYSAEQSLHFSFKLHKLMVLKWSAKIKWPFV